MDKSFHAGRSFEPLPNGLTRIKSYADGGALLSDEVVPLQESVKQIQAKQLPEQEVTVESIGHGVYSVYSVYSKDSIAISEQGLRDLLAYARKHEQGKLALKEQVLKAVEEYVIHRYADISVAEMDWDAEEIERIKFDQDGHLDFTVEDMEVEDGKEEGTYYISATLYFQVDSGDAIEGSTDTYEAYRDVTGKWCINWHSS